MKRTSIQLLAFTVVTAITGFAAATTVHAETALVIQIGNQAPPQPQQDHQWASPYHSAAWIPGHNEWQSGQYVWVGGYYAYPPRPHSHWVAPSYPHNQSGYSYHPGHWSN